MSCSFGRLGGIFDELETQRAHEKGCCLVAIGDEGDEPEMHHPTPRCVRWPLGRLVAISA